MGKQTIIERVKEWLAGICWRLFLWLNNLTENEYFRQIKEQELRMGESRPLEKLVMPKIAGEKDFDWLDNKLERILAGIEDGTTTKEGKKNKLHEIIFDDLVKEIQDLRDSNYER